MQSCDSFFVVSQEKFLTIQSSGRWNETLKHYPDIILM